MLTYYDKSATRKEQQQHQQKDTKCPILGYDSVQYRWCLHTFRKKLLALLLTCSVRAQPVSSTY